MPPPAPPLPKLDGLFYWINHDASISNPSDLDQNEGADVDSLKSPGHQQIRTAVQEECYHLQEELVAARKAWRRAKSSADALQQNEGKDEDITSDMQRQQAALQERQWRQKITVHSWKYRLCLANTLCPRQCQVYGNCWKYAVRALGPDAMKQMQQNRSLDAVCQAEREMVQRCVGRHIAGALEEKSQSQYDCDADGTGCTSTGMPSSMT